MCLTTLILQPYLWLGGLSPPLFRRFANLFEQCKDIENISQFQIFEELFLDEALTLAYGVDTRTSNFADVAEAYALTQ